MATAMREGSARVVAKPMLAANK
jgi:hypothetical protein